MTIEDALRFAIDAHEGRRISTENRSSFTRLQSGCRDGMKSSKRLVSYTM